MQRMPTTCATAENFVTKRSTSETEPPRRGLRILCEIVGSMRKRIDEITASYEIMACTSAKIQPYVTEGHCTKTTLIFAPHVSKKKVNKVVRDKEDDASISRQEQIECFDFVWRVVMIVQNMGPSLISIGSGGTVAGVAERREDVSELCWEDQAL